MSNIELVCVVLFSSIVVSVFSSMMRSSPVANVLEIIVSSYEDKFCSVSDAFPVIDSSSEVKLSSELKYYFNIGVIEPRVTFTCQVWRSSNLRRVCGHWTVNTCC